MSEQNRVQKIGEYSYFVTEQSAFGNTILNYDPKIANLTVVWEPLEAELEVPEEELNQLTIEE